MSARDTDELAIRQQLDAVEVRLVEEFGDRLPMRRIRAVVRQHEERFAGAPVRQYVPLLIGRAARADVRRLAGQAGGRAGR